jgi:hypothetical protein
VRANGSSHARCDAKEDTDHDRTISLPTTILSLHTTILENVFFQYILLPEMTSLGAWALLSKVCKQWNYLCLDMFERMRQKRLMP